MQSSNIPAKFPLAFANNAVAPYIRPIPTNSQVGITPGAASLYDGFVQLNFQPESSGGIPPSGQDFNGILKMITLWIQWVNAGGQVPFDATFAAAISGYPKGAQILADAGNFWYQSTIENNTNNPNTGGAGWQQVIPSAPSTTVPNMDGTGAVGTAITFARADHVHPTDTSRAALSYVNSTFETIAAANATFLPKVNPVVSGNLVVGGDTYTYRPAAPTTGVIFLNQAGSRYLYFDGTNYNLPFAELFVNSVPVVSSITTAQSTANNALASAMGSGQTYQAFNRAYATNFVNSTVRPIFVNLQFTASNSGGHSATAVVDGVTAAVATAVLNNSVGFISFIVPPGSTYRINTDGFVNGATWYELR